MGILKCSIKIETSYTIWRDVEHILASFQGQKPLKKDENCKT